ncbi:MAG: hypothetical protein C0497_09890 [Gemmatimonas sp.]|nr:hypothetical protein [Gemmatimonas sp.]
MPTRAETTVTTDRGAFGIAGISPGTFVLTSFAFGFARRVDTLEVPRQTNVYVELVMPFGGGDACSWPMIVRTPWWKFW